MADIPAGLTYGTVVGLFNAVVADGVDEGLLPDMEDLNGEILLTPTARIVRVGGALTPRTLIAKEVTVKVEGGKLIGPDNQAGVRLLASDSPNISPTNFAWHVVFTLNNVPVQPPEFDFYLPGGSTIDLGAVMPTTQPGVVQITTEATRIAAELAATRAEAARAGMIVGFEISNGRAYSISVDGTRKDLGAALGPQGIQGLPGDMSPATNFSGTGNLNITVGSLPSTNTCRLTGNVVVLLDMTNMPPSRSATITMVFKQASTGSGPFTVTWPSSLLWAGGAPAPAMPTASNAELVVHLFWTGLGYRAVFGGVYYP